MTFDVEKYRHHLDRLNLSEEDRIALVHTMRAMADALIDIELGQDSTQLCQREDVQIESDLAADMIEFKQSLTAISNKAARNQNAAESHLNEGE